MGKQQESKEKLSYVEVLHRYSSRYPLGQEVEYIESQSEISDPTPALDPSIIKPLDQGLSDDIKELDSTLQRYFLKNRRKCYVCNQSIAASDSLAPESNARGAFSCSKCKKGAHFWCYFSDKYKVKYRQNGRSKAGDAAEPELCDKCSSDTPAECTLCNTSGGLIRKSKYFYHPSCALFGLSHNPLSSDDVDALIERYKLSALACPPKLPESQPLLSRAAPDTQNIENIEEGSNTYKENPGSHENNGTFTETEGDSLLGKGLFSQINESVKRGLKIIKTNITSQPASTSEEGFKVPVNKLECIICSSCNAKFTFQCSYPHCPFYIHPVCAVNNNLGAVYTTLGRGNSRYPWAALFCPKHSNVTDIKISALNYMRYQRIKLAQTFETTCENFSAISLESASGEASMKAESGNGEIPSATKVGAGSSNNKLKKPVFQNFHPFVKGSWQKAEHPRRMPLGPAAARALALVPLSHRKKSLEGSKHLMCLLRLPPTPPPSVAGIEQQLRLLRHALWSGRGSYMCRDKRRRVLALVSLGRSSETGVTPSALLATFTISEGPQNGNDGIGNAKGAVNPGIGEQSYKDKLESLISVTNDASAQSYPFFCVQMDNVDNMPTHLGQLKKSLANYSASNAQLNSGLKLSLETVIPLSSYEFELVRLGVLEVSQDPLQLRLLTITGRSCASAPSKQAHTRHIDWYKILEFHGVSKARHFCPSAKPASFSHSGAYVDLAGYRWILDASPTTQSGPVETPASHDQKLSGNFLSQGADAPYNNNTSRHSNFINQQTAMHEDALVSLQTEIARLKSALVDSILSQNCEPLSIAELPSCRYTYLVADSSDRWSLLRSNLTLAAQEDAARWEAGAEFSEDAKATLCCVCFCAKKTNLNPMITCVRCGITFHRSCYGVGLPASSSQYPNRDWDSGELVCKRCEVEKKSLGTQWMLNFRRNSVLCVVCLRGGGAFKTTTSGHWIHVFCGLALLPSAQLLDPSALEPWQLPLPDSSNNRHCCFEPCIICGVPLGITLRCAWIGPEGALCNILSHPMCAWLQGLRFNVQCDTDQAENGLSIPQSLAPYYPPFRVHYLCPSHDLSWDTQRVCEYRKSKYLNRDVDPAHNEVKRKGRFRGLSRPHAESREAEAKAPSRLSIPLYDSKTCAVCHNALSREFESASLLEDTSQHLLWTRCDECRIAIHLRCYMFDIAGTVGFNQKTLPNGLAPWPTPVPAGQRGPFSAQKVMLHETPRSSVPPMPEELENGPKRWVCDPCTFGLAGSTICAICMRSDRGLKAWASFGSKGGRESFIFVHVVCLVWHADWAVGLVKKGQLPVREDGASCSVCSSTQGALLKCSKPACHTMFHASCASQVGLVLHKSGVRVKRKRGTNAPLDATAEDEPEDTLEAGSASGRSYGAAEDLDPSEEGAFGQHNASQWHLHSGISLCPSHSDIAGRFASSLLLFFKLKESLGLTAQLAVDLKHRELVKRAWIRKRKELLNAAFPVLPEMNPV